MSTPPKPGSIFIVVDPAQERPLALERAVITSKIFKDMDEALIPKVHVFLAVDADNTDTSSDNPNIRRSSEWFLERIVEPLKEAGGQYSVEISWSTDWYGSILTAAKEQNAERIMIPMVKKPGGSDRLFNESMWKMMRTAHCPVLVVQPDSPAERKTVLVAINIQSSKPEYQKLNDQIITRGQWLAKSYGADLHVVNAYKSSLSYPDRGELAKKTGVDTANIHVKAGDPEDVISDVAKNIGADIVVLGTQSRTSRWRGNTSEKIITKVDCDILAIN